MKAKLKNLVWLAAVFGLLLPAADSVSSQTRKTAILPDVSSPIKVTGICSIDIDTRTNHRLLNASITLTDKGKPVIKRKVFVDRKLVPEYQPGRYRVTIHKHYMAGYPILLSIEPLRVISRVNLPLAKPPTPIKFGEARVVEPMRFIPPTPLAFPSIMVPILPHREFKISWHKGRGVGPMQCNIYEFPYYNSDRPLDEPIYKSGHISTTSVVVSTEIFKPKRKYGIYIYRKMGDFHLWKGRVAAGSSMVLRHSVGTYIFAH